MAERFNAFKERKEEERKRNAIDIGSAGGGRSYGGRGGSHGGFGGGGKRGAFGRDFF